MARPGQIRKEDIFLCLARAWEGEKSIIMWLDLRILKVLMVVVMMMFTMSHV